MTRQINGKLKHLLETVPPGFLVDTPWLASRNIDRKLAYWYVKRGWLESAAQGVYRRPVMVDDSVSGGAGWKTTVISIQQLMGYDVHLGGRTALNIQGFYHYLAFSPGRWPLIMSSPERAILEMLNELPKNESFHILDKLFEGLSSLRPELLGELLRLCSSIKVKRYFFVFADRHKHGWRKYISTTGIDLGSGPRFTFAGGRIHPEYKISVPAEFLSSSDWNNADGA